MQQKAEHHPTPQKWEKKTVYIIDIAYISTTAVDGRYQTMKQKIGRKMCSNSTTEATHRSVIQLFLIDQYSLTKTFGELYWDFVSTAISMTQ